MLASTSGFTPEGSGPHITAWHRTSGTHAAPPPSGTRSARKKILISFYMYTCICAHRASYSVDGLSRRASTGFHDRPRDGLFL